MRASVSQFVVNREAVCNDICVERNKKLLVTLQTFLLQPRVCLIDCRFLPPPQGMGRRDRGRHQRAFTK